MIDAATYMQWSVNCDMTEQTCWTFISKVLWENYKLELPQLVGGLKNVEHEAEVIKQQQLDGDWEETDSPACGDVVLFLIGGKRPHVGICTGPKGFIHFSQTDRTVKADLHSGLRWRNRVVGFYRNTR